MLERYYPSWPALWRGIRDAVEFVGWLVLLTICFGHVTLTNFDLRSFVNGGLWIGVPLAIMTTTYVRNRP